jgi:hypothetical protein
MTINLSPLDQQVHMKQLEPKFGGSIYDHSNQPLTGWRAERQHAENNVAARQNQGDQGECSANMNKPDINRSWVARIANMFNTPRFAN